MTAAERKERQRKKEKVIAVLETTDQHGKSEKEVSIGTLSPDGKLTITKISDRMQAVDIYGQPVRTPKRDDITRGTKPATVEVWIENAVDDLLGSHDSSKCPFCDLTFPSTTSDWSRADMSEHLWLMFRVGEKQREKWEERREIILDHNTADPEHGLPIDPLLTTEYAHYLKLWTEIDRVREERRKPRKNGRNS
jgi:hypothetical protein